MRRFFATLDSREVETSKVTMRETLVRARRSQGWRIVHERASPLPTGTAA